MRFQIFYWALGKVSTHWLRRCHSIATGSMNDLMLMQQDAHQAAIAALQREIQLLRAENSYLREQVWTAPAWYVLLKSWHISARMPWQCMCLPLSKSIWVGP